MTSKLQKISIRDPSHHSSSFMSFPWIGPPVIDQEELSTRRENEYCNRLRNLECILLKQKEDIRIFKPSLQPIGTQPSLVKEEAVGILRGSDGDSVMSSANIDGDEGFDDDDVEVDNDGIVLSPN